MDDYTKLIGIKLAGGTPDLGLNHIIVKELAKDPLFANCLFDVDNADTWDDIFSTQLREVKKVWKIVSRSVSGVTKVCYGDRPDFRTLEWGVPVCKVASIRIGRGFNLCVAPF